MESARLSESRVREWLLCPYKQFRYTGVFAVDMHMCDLCSIMKPHLFDSFRCEGNVSRSDSDCAETRNQSGHPILRDELAAQLVQR